MNLTESGEALRFRRCCAIAADHPAFAGHFPGHPILPGVVLLAEVLEVIRAIPALAAALGAQPLLLATKFLAPVEPGKELQIDLQLIRAVLEFEISVAGLPVARGKYRALSR